MTKCAAVIAAGAVVAGCGGTDLDGLKDSEIPVWYLGTSFEGLELSHADSVVDRALLAYGECVSTGSDEPFSEAGCNYPLQVTSCLNSDEVVLYGRRRLVHRAARALRPLNEPARRIGRPYVKYNFGDC